VFHASVNLQFINIKDILIYFVWSESSSRHCFKMDRFVGDKRRYNNVAQVVMFC